MLREYGIKLTELIDIDILQHLQDIFSEMTGMAAVITQADGIPITKPSNFTEYCSKYTRCSELGNVMCEECDRFGGEEALRTGEAICYCCHSGLTDFAAPIAVDNKLIGCFVGGQVLTEPPDEANVREIAEVLDVDGDEYWEAAQKVNIITQADVDKAFSILKTMAKLLSEVAYSKYITNKANEELEHAAKMQGDFLANMSHEIRTPMNAVIGFAELALREEASDSAKDYIEQIKSSSKALLTIINDILDYSKIQSSKLDIVPVTYEPLSIIDDVANISMTRLTEKEVEFLLDIDPNIPTMLEGDNMRLRQILINLCNNATKFTNQGYVELKVGYEWVDYSNISLNFEVKDTGIGIKEENLNSIFNSFTQVDSKRNRNIEGSGLGLAICKLLLELMGSKIEVESKYGEGSTFSFKLIQKVIDAKPSIIVESVKNIYLGGDFSNKYVADNFVKAAKYLGVEASASCTYDKDEKVAFVDDWKKNSEGKEKFFFIEQQSYDTDIMKEQHDSSCNIILLAETFSNVKEYAGDKNLLILRKPVSVMNLGSLLNHKGLRYRSNRSEEEVYNFTAEDASILIVDDNIVNLTVARGLLEPLKCNIDMSASGKDALQKIRLKRYDIIFMDHMMPDLDGIETTHIIRKEHMEYTNVPIIALTANAMSGVKEMFISEGMTDFIPKPIELRILIEKVKDYLPVEKITPCEGVDESLFVKEETVAKAAPVIGDLNTETAIELLGSEALFDSVLRIYYENIEDKAAEIERLYKDENWPKYAIEVHALKSSSRQIGAMELGDFAYTLEMAGKNLDLYLIRRDTEELLSKYRSYKAVLSEYFNKTNTKTETVEGMEATKELLNPIFDKLREAIDNLDMDECEECLKELNKFTYPEMWEGKMKALRNGIKEMDVEECLDVLDSWN